MSDPAAILKCKPHLVFLKKLGACTAPSVKATRARSAAAIYASVLLIPGSGVKKLSNLPMSIGAQIFIVS